MFKCMPNVQDTIKKITYQTKNQGDFDLNERRHLTDANTETTQILKLSKKDFKLPS